ncbi:MAG TPA: GDP-mannose 4,6-dehydratase [Anaerolineae bacterium]
MRVFVTGATGFAGSHLVEHLLAAGHQIFALVHTSSSLHELPDHAHVTALSGDLLDPESLKATVSQAQPEVIYHLAGQAYPARSWEKPAFTLAVNAGGTANLLEAAIHVGRPRVVAVTSADIYGFVRPEELPLTEKSMPQPRHPYGVSKWAAGQLVSLYWQRYQLPVVEARPFNHIGPRQALGFVVPDFASQLAAIKLGKRPPKMRVGNLEAQRDFTDVRDVVRAYVDLAEKGQPGEAYLICSGLPVAIHYLLTTLAELAETRVELEYDPARMRPSDIPCLYGSYDKIQQQTGWRPQIHLRQSLADTLAEWLAKVETEGQEG